MSDADGVTRRFVLSAASPSQRGTATLIVLEGALVGRRYVVEDLVTIGRGDAASIQIDDTVASRRHAMIRTDGTAWRVADLGSQNGTWVNGRKISESAIQFGDRIQIGETLFLFSFRDPLEDRARQRQKLETLGRLGAGVAHDLNNLLGSILANADLLPSLHADASRPDGAAALATFLESIDDIRTAAQRGGELTRRMLDHAVHASSGDTTVDFTSVVQTSVSLARRTFDNAIRVDEQIAPGIMVRGDRSALAHVVMGLVVNAGDALAEGGRIVVRLGIAASDRASRADVGFAGQHATLEVTGASEGSTADLSDLKLDPLARNSESNMGRALATAAEVVGEHGGRITVHSTSEGASVRLVLPALAHTREAPVASTPHVGVPITVAPRTSTDGVILVVDDDDLVRRTVLRLLTRDGYRTIEAASGRDALAAFRQSRSDIRLVLLDLDMPDMNGEDTYTELLAVDPNVRVAFLTGLCDEARRNTLLGRGARAVLLKPCDTATLRQTVRQESGIAATKK